MPTATQKVGNAGLQGWRRNIAEKVAPPVADRSPLNRDQVKALVGGAFLVLTATYVVKAVHTLISEARNG